MTCELRTAAALKARFRDVLLEEGREVSEECLDEMVKILLKKDEDDQDTYALFASRRACQRES